MSVSAAAAILLVGHPNVGKSVLFHRLTGAYVNVPNAGMPSWEIAYWGSNVDRLRDVKATYDPDTVFSFEQSVGPATAT